MNVHCVLVEKPIPSNIDLIRDLIGAVDEGSLLILDQLMHSDVFREPHQNIQEIGTVEIKKDTSPLDISRIVEKKGYTHTSLSSCLYLLSFLKSRENKEIRRTFFEDGRTLLSTCPVMLKGELNYVIIGQDQCHKKCDQHPFSIRLLTAPKIFLHSLYRVLVAKV